MKRLILIHGYVEDPGIFDVLAPLLPSSNLLRIGVEAEFDRWQPTGPVNAYTLAEFLVKAYTITADDVVIGHSMGGWIAINIKAFTGATTIQISSYTNQRKVVSPVYSLSVIRFLANTGVLQSRPAVNRSKKKYTFVESKGLFIALVNRMSGMRSAYISWQMEILFAPAPPLTVSPDLRIHAKKDNIVSPPKESYSLVPGDHFSLVFYPYDVAKPIQQLFVDSGFAALVNPAASL